MVTLTFAEFDNLWEFLIQFALLFFLIWGLSYIILRIARKNKKIHLFVHPVVTIIFGTIMLGLFFSGTLITFGYSINYFIKKVPSTFICHLGLATGLGFGILVITRIYLIDEGNKQYQGWIYLISILFGLPVGILEFLRGFELFSFWMSSVPLMYLGTKIGVWYLRKRRINRWREKGLKE